MLSGVLNSDKAINMNIALMRTFVEIRRLALKQNDLKEQLQEIKQRIGEHDMQLNSIYDAIEKLKTFWIKKQHNGNGMKENK